MSMVRLLVYSNQLDIEGLIATTSTWMRATVRPDVLHKVIAAYGEVRSRLEAQAPGYPTAAALDALVAKGQEGYGMAAVGADRLSPGAEAIIKAVDRPRCAPALGAGLGRHQHARAGAVPRAAHAHAGRPRDVRRQAARLRDLRSGRRRAVAAPHLPEPALHRDAVVAGRRGVLPRDMDRHQRRSLLPQRARRRLHDLLRRLDPGQHPQPRPARRALHPALLHPRGRHAVVPRPDRQRPRQRDEPDLRRLGRTLRVAAAVRRVAAVLDAGRRFLPGARQLARHRDRRRRAAAHDRPGDDLALAHGLPARLRRAHGVGVRARQPTTTRASS